MGVPTTSEVLPTRVPVAVVGPVSQKKVLPTRAHVAVAERVSQKEGGVGVPTPPAVLPTSVPVDDASPLSQVVCSHGPVDVSTGPAVLECSSSSAPVPCLRGLVDTSVDQSRPNCSKMLASVSSESSKMLADVSSKSADLHGQSSPSALSSHQIPPGARVPAHSILSTREEHFTQQVDESRKTLCREKHSSQLVSDACLPVCAVGPRSRHKDTSPRRSKVLSLFADRSQAQRSVFSGTGRGQSCTLPVVGAVMAASDATFVLSASSWYLPVESFACPTET